MYYLITARTWLDDTRTPAETFGFPLPTTNLVGSPSHQDQANQADVEKSSQQAS